MITTWSPHSKTAAENGSAAAMIDYLVSAAVNKSARGPDNILVRDPAPEVLSGDPDLVRDLINALPWQHGYSTVTLSFAEDDIPVLAFNTGQGTHRKDVGRILRLFGEVAFAGILPVHRPPLFICTHTHTGRLEVNIALPRMVQRPTGEVRSYNPHPPVNGSRALWDSFTDMINGHFCYADPRSPEHMRLVAMPSWKLKQRAEAERGGLANLRSPWSGLAAHALTLYHCDEVLDRRTLLEAMEQELIGRGVEILRVSNDSATFGIPDGGSWRMRGYLFSSRFDRHAARRERPEQDLQALRELELRAAPARLHEGMLRRAGFNASRHGGTCPVPDPLAVLRAPPLPIPPCQPQTQRTKLPRRMTPILSRLVVTIGQVVDRLQDRLRDILALNTLARCDLSPFTNIRETLETLNARYSDTNAPARSAGTADDHENARGADRAAADDPGNGSRAGRGRPTRGAAGGAVVDQREYSAGGEYNGRRAGGTGRGAASPQSRGGAVVGDAVRDQRVDDLARRAPTGNTAAKLRMIREAADLAGMTGVSIRTLGSAILLRADDLVFGVRESVIVRGRTRSPEAREMLENLCEHASLDLPVRYENREVAPGF